MYPVLIQLGSFELRSYGIIVALSFFLGLWLSAREAKRKGIEPGLVQDFSHLPRHNRGELFFSVLQNSGGSKKDLRAPGRGHGHPTQKRPLRRLDGVANIRGPGPWQDANDISAVRRIQIQEGFAALCAHRFTIDVIVIGFHWLE